MIRFALPLKTPSVANQREHWAVKAKRTATQRKAAMVKCPPWTEGPLMVVTIIRVGPRELDSDNLASACKGYRDGIAARLKVDDGSPLIRWVYDQLRGEPGVQVLICRAEPVAGCAHATDDVCGRCRK